MKLSITPEVLRKWRRIAAEGMESDNRLLNQVAEAFDYALDHIRALETRLAVLDEVLIPKDEVTLTAQEVKSEYQKALER